MKRPGAHLDEAQAQRLVERVLPEAEEAQATAHAAGCPECAALVESYRALSAALDELPGLDVPEGFTAAVLERVEERERSAERERLTAVAVLAAVAVALVAGLLLGGNGAWVPTTTRLAEQLGSVAQALHVGARVVPPLMTALRLPIALVCAALSLTLLLALSRFTSSPRTEAI
jgi:anti-sigma factor RsiW